MIGNLNSVRWEGLQAPRVSSSITRFVREYDLHKAITLIFYCCNEWKLHAAQRQSNAPRENLGGNNFRTDRARHEALYALLHIDFYGSMAGNYIQLSNAATWGRKALDLERSPPWCVSVGHAFRHITSSYLFSIFLSISIFLPRCVYPMPMLEHYICFHSEFAHCLGFSFPSTISLSLSLSLCISYADSVPWCIV